MPLLYQQIKTLPLPEATWGIRTHPSSLEQSCQGATYYKQTLIRKSKTKPITSGNLEFK
jgi:hypothetical protein